MVSGREVPDPNGDSFPCTIPTRKPANASRYDIMSDVWSKRGNLIVAVCGDPYECVYLDEQVLREMLDELSN